MGYLFALGYLLLAALIGIATYSLTPQHIREELNDFIDNIER